MELTFAPRDILQIDDARIIFRNFRGEASKYNRAGDRNFALVIPNEKIANELADRGWNVKIKPPKEDGDEPFMYLSVKVKFNERGPQVYLKTGEAVNKLDEESVAVLDDIDIVSVNMDIRPFRTLIALRLGTQRKSIRKINREENILLYERSGDYGSIRV